MRSYLFIGGNQDGRNIPLQHDLESVELLVNITDKEAYVRDTISVGNASVAIYRHESLTSELVLDRMLEHYKAWCVNGPGGRRNE
jgi:hypothetical protein